MESGQLRKLPPNSRPARRTPTFDQQSVPPALLGHHHTTVWAELVVEAGQVAFEEEEPRWRTMVATGERQAIVPNRRHHIEPSHDAVFYVQFYDPPNEADALG